MPLVYDDRFTVVQTECDPWDRMTPGAILRRVQETSTAQCESVGLNEALYQKTHTVFLLSRISLEIYTPPAIAQPVHIQTRAYGMQRAVYQRVTTLYSEAGEKLCETDSRWMLVNTQTKHILRREPEGFTTPFMDLPGTEGHVLDMPKTKEVQPCAQLRASYTLCDRNGHVNNTRYADILCDALPLEQLAKGPVKKMLLYYRSEIPLGSGFSLACAEAGEGTYFTAQLDGRKCFEGYTAF